MPVTMQQVADEAGISRATVSLILSGRGTDLRIATETQERVLGTAKRLGYRRNELARSVRRGRSKVLAFIGGTSSSYVMSMISGINQGAQEHGYTLKMFPLKDISGVNEAIRHCQEQMVAGVICRSLDDNGLKLLKENLCPEVPVVQLDNSHQREWCGRVVSADVAGGILAVNHLLELGHRRIGLITAAEDSGNTDYAAIRAHGYREALQQAGIEVEEALTVAVDHNMNWKQEQGEVLARYLRKVAPTAVFCVSDPIAMKVLLVCQQLGISVPQDLSVVGYANLAFTAVSAPPLTTVCQLFTEMGKAAAELIIDELNGGKPVRNVSLELPVHLTLRQSTAALIEQ